MDNNNVPIDSTEFYFPLEMFPVLNSKYIEVTPNNFEYQNSIVEGKFDEFLIKWYSKQLFALNEPLLFNKNQDKEIYRFTYLRTFDNPISIRIEKDKTGIYLTWKKSDGKGGFEPGKIIIDRQCNLNLKDWILFKSKIRKANFWNLELGRSITGEDGSEWILEGFTPENYRVITMWSLPAGDFYETCIYLISLTDLELEKKY